MRKYLLEMTFETPRKGDRPVEEIEAETVQEAHVKASKLMAENSRMVSCVVYVPTHALKKVVKVETAIVTPPTQLPEPMPTERGK
jgi:hypothetical protein